MDVQSEQTKRRPADESLAQARESRGAVRREERPEVWAPRSSTWARRRPVSGAVDSDDAGLLTCGTPVNQPCG